MPIRLDRHAILEASAGTGKTHQMVELVCRLLTEENVDLAQILVVTFTDKATGELRSRLREALEQLCETEPKHRACAQAALDNFEQANVCTIHGFCQRTLQEFAFENGQEFRAQLVSDPELLETCLREVQRTRWRAEFRGLLPLVLELSRYSKDMQGAATWEDLVRELACRHRPWCGHDLLPACCEGFAATIREREEALRRLRVE
ncbi:MAG TPA: UvrD-helicase domain-containing protein, partial [Gemmataceae bacterium]|nr:UvrD-helicase domain-containing protein [Gemmataceae bacterium]